MRLLQERRVFVGERRQGETMMWPPNSLVSDIDFATLHLIEIESSFPAASQSGLPSAAADGSVTMNLHQVNQDGAGCVSMLSVFVLRANNTFLDPTHAMFLVMAAKLSKMQL